MTWRITFQFLWNSMLLTISPWILGASFCFLSLSSSSGVWVPQGNSSGVVQVLLALAGGTVDAQVSSVPHQVQESESVLSSSGCAEQPFSSVLPHIRHALGIRNFWGTVSAPAGGVLLSHRGAQKRCFESALSFTLTPHLLFSDGQTSANSCSPFLLTNV